MQTIMTMVNKCNKNNQALTKLIGLLDEGKSINQAQINMALLKSQVANTKLLLKMQSNPTTGGYSGDDMVNDILNGFGGKK